MRVAPVRAGRGVAIVAIAAGLVLTGCGPRAEASAVPSSAALPTSTSSLPAATPTASTASTASTEPASPTPEVTPMPTESFSLSSEAFGEGGSIPREYTCDGEDVSPALAWVGVPAGTATVALIVDDPDARGFVHWLIFDIDPGSGGLARGASTTAGAPPQGRNDFGRTGYGGPCPPSGTHHYVFRLLALDSALSLGGGSSAADVLAAANGHTLAETRLTATYRRGG